MLGATELVWFEQSLLASQQQGVVWKFVAVSSPIDQMGGIGSSFTITNGANNGPGTFSTVINDGGKSWMGGYRPERNALLKFIADNHIDHVVFLSTDDHQLRINELGYFTQFDASNTPIQSSYVRIPGVFSVVAGPIGATGPDLVTDHGIANIQALAQNFAGEQIARGIDPIGLDPSFPGLKNVSREGDATAATSPKPLDFYSPDTFNYATFDVSADGSTLDIGVEGINSYAINTFPQPGSDNPLRQILSFQIGLKQSSLAVGQTTAIIGSATTTLKATLTDGATNAALANKAVAFTLNGVAVGTATTDASGVASLANVSLAGLNPGTYAVKATFAGDAADLPASGSGTLHVAYDVSLNFDNTNARSAGSTLPIKLSLKDATGRDVSSADLAVSAIGIAPAASPNDLSPPQSPGNSNPGNLFTFNGGKGGGYEFDLKTTGMAAGNYVFYYKIGSDPTLYQLQFVLK
jgi:hypothetical protein